MTLLRRVVAVVAIAVGVGVTAGTATAAAATPTHKALTAQHSVSTRAHPTALADWWW